MKFFGKNTHNKRPLNWSDINVQDDKSKDHCVKRIVLEISAGDLCTMTVEEYGIENSDMDDGAIKYSINSSYNSPVTTIKTYFVDELSIKTKSVKPICEQDSQNKIINAISVLEL